MFFDHSKIYKLRIQKTNKDGTPITRSQLANETGLNQSMPISLENGYRINPSFDTVLILCNYYNVSPYQITQEPMAKEMLSNFLTKMFREGNIDLSSPEKCKKSIEEYHFLKIEIKKENTPDENS